MPLKYLIDEHLRGKFAQGLLAHARDEGITLDILETDGRDGPPLGTQDDELLRWCELNQRILVSLDKNSLPGFLKQHLASGNSSPGILLLRRERSWEELLHYLALFAEVARPEECANCCVFIPL